MARTTAEPGVPVRSMEELLALARALAADAAARYAALGQRLRDEGRGDLAPVLDNLAALERGHEAEIEALAQQRRSGFASGFPAGFVAGLASGFAGEGVPALFDDGELGVLPPEGLGAYPILATAVRNEERAFSFWSYVAANARAKDVARMAERLALGELMQARLLRVKRRQAYHEERRRQGTAPHRLVEAEEEIAAILDRCAGRLRGDAAVWCRVLADEARDNGAQLRRTPLHRPRIRDVPNHGLFALSEWLADHYIRAAETLGQEEDRKRAQELAGRAVRRLAFVRRLTAMPGIV